MRYQNIYLRINIIFKINICYGIKGDGNLYDMDNIMSINDEINEKYNFITADGGLDFSKDFNNQEDTIFKLLFVEIFTAFIYLEEKGDFILKIFDILTQDTLELIYLLSNFFENIIIYKPYLSRNSNSEKYLICKNFKGISKRELNKLTIIYKIIENNDISNYSLFTDLPVNFIEKIYEYNKIMICGQIKNIFKTILEVNNYENILNNFNWCKLYINN